MGKKKSRATQTSKGIHHQNPNRPQRRIAKAMRLEYKGSIEHGTNQRAAWRRGKRVMLTIPNPDASNTKERFVRVNANEIWGDWRFADRGGKR